MVSNYINRNQDFAQKAIIASYQIINDEVLINVIDANPAQLSYTMDKLKESLQHPTHRTGTAYLMEYKSATLLEFTRRFIQMFPRKGYYFLELGMINLLKDAIQSNSNAFAKDAYEAALCLDIIITDLFEIKRIHSGILMNKVLKGCLKIFIFCLS